MINIDAFEELDELPSKVAIKKPVFRKKLQQLKANMSASAGNSVNSLMECDDDFPYSYQPSRFEGRWLIESLGGFYDERWFDDVLRMIKGGKEASVYLCRGNETTGKDLLAAKVYRPRMYRNLKDDHVYREGRTQFDEAGLEIRDDRALKAIEKRTNFGLSLLQIDWIQHEFITMQTLYESGGALPKPFICANNAILMEYIGDEDVPAPTLNTVNLTHRSAARLFGKVVENVRLMLRHNLIHGDFSAYNLLYWDDDIYMIDFPQSFSYQKNHSAWMIFNRDLERVCQYFSRQGVSVDAENLAQSLWKEKDQPSILEIEQQIVQE